MDNDSIYVGMMNDSLQRKKRLLGLIYNLTSEQEKVLRQNEFDYDKFQLLVDDKGKYIDEIAQIDDGFDALFKRLEDTLNKNNLKI